MSAAGKALQIRVQPFVDDRDAALALLSRAVQVGAIVERKESSFLGAVAGGSDVTPRMARWLDGLLVRASLPPVERER